MTWLRIETSSRLSLRARITICCLRAMVWKRWIKAQKGRPDLILMDIRMPNMDGTWARQLLKDDPATSHIPVIAQTASSMAGESERLKKFFDGYLRKPFSRKKLFTALAMHLPLGRN